MTSLPRMLPRDRSQAELTDFSTNDYLGFSCDPTVKALLAAAVADYPTGSTGSRLLSGDSDIFHELEREIAGFRKKSDALFFNTGYQANVGIFQGLCDSKAIVFADRYCHASIWDGIRLSGAHFKRYRHGDYVHLRQLLERYSSSYNECFIVSESLFSMDGDVADIGKLAELKHEYDCRLIIDDSHGTYILSELDNYAAEIDVIVMTFGKAFGSIGAAVVCDELTKKKMVNFSRSFIYSTALPPYVAAFNLALLRGDFSIRERVSKAQALASLVRENLKKKSFKVIGNSLIIPVIIGDADRTAAFSQRLEDMGFRIPAIREPTVPKGQSRLRLTITAAHTEKDVDRLLDVFSSLAGLYGSYVA